MSEMTESPQQHDSKDFAQQAEEAPPGLIAEFLDFLLNNKKWWLTPIIVILLLFGAFILFGGGPLAPFIYTVW